MTAPAPSPSDRADRADRPARTLVEVEDLRVEFPVRSSTGTLLGTVHAVDGVSFTIREGEVVGLVGESGCGKSTLGRALVGLARPHSGSIRFRSGRHDQELEQGTRPYRAAIQMVFQDPYSALNPKRRIGSILHEALLVQGKRDRAANRRRAEELMESFGFGAEALERFPHQFSGGQLQRIGVARAIINRPELVVCDEPVSALDVSIQSQILNLLSDLHRDDGYSYLFITHDLTVVQYISDRVLVMYLGEIVEELPPDALSGDALHPYTRMLAAAVPGATTDAEVRVEGELPSPLDPPSGCRFRTRCPHAMDVCAEEPPALLEISPGRNVRCHLYSHNCQSETTDHPGGTP